MSLLLLTPLTISPSTGEVISLHLTPSNPVVGDTVTVTGTANPGENIELSITYHTTVKSINGKYEYRIYDVEIPPGNNKFSVTARDTVNLYVSVKKLIWLTKASDATDGVATVTQVNVPKGTYDVIIYGETTSREVNITITATKTIPADSEGNFTYEYNTASIPSGRFLLRANNYAMWVTLTTKEKPEEKAPDEVTPTPSQTPSQTPSPASTPLQTPPQPSAPVPRGLFVTMGIKEFVGLIIAVLITGIVIGVYIGRRK